MAIQNPREIHNGQVTESTTEPPRADGQPNTHVQVIKRKKLLYIMLYYNGKEASGGEQCRCAANYKTERIMRGGSFNMFDTDILKNVEVQQFQIYKIKDFQETWTKVYKLANQDNYTLQEVHIFAHGGHNVFYLKGENFTYDLVANLEVLPFSKTGALVLHTCRGGRFEDNNKDDYGNLTSNQCIARVFSEHLKTKVIGQMTYSLFNPVTSLGGTKYYNMEYLRRGLTLGLSNLVLWSYKIGNAPKSAHGDQPDYQALADGQLWTARVFENGNNGLYTYGKDVFNAHDLKYI